MSKQRFEKLVKFLIYSILASAFLTVFMHFAFAQDVSSVVRSVGEQSNLPSFDAGHSDQAAQPGASNITSTIYFALDFFRYVFGGIAVLMIIISGMKLILAARNIDDVMNKEKNTLRYAFSGLIMILLADQVLRLVFFGEEGEVFRSGEDIQEAAERGTSIASGVLDMIRVFIPSVAVLFVIIAGIRLVLSQGDQEKANKAKTMLTWAIIGLIVAGLAELVVYQIIFPDAGTRLSDPYAFNRLIITMTNFVSGFISTVAVVMMIYAGYLYVVSGGGEGVEKAKKIVMGAVIGLLLAMAAFALVNTFVKLEPLTEDIPVADVPLPDIQN